MGKRIFARDQDIFLAIEGAAENQRILYGTVSIITGKQYTTWQPVVGSKVPYGVCKEKQRDPVTGYFIRYEVVEVFDRTTHPHHEEVALFLNKIRKDGATYLPLSFAQVFQDLVNAGIRQKLIGVIHAIQR